MGTLIINFKNFSEVLGGGSLRLAEAAERVSKKLGVEIIVCPPGPMLSAVSTAVRIPVFSQAVQESRTEQSTGAVVPEAVKAAGARGTILNHSENRADEKVVKRLAPRLEAMGLEVCLCVNSVAEATRYATLGTSFLAIEPPELIGSGRAVSTAKPFIVEGTVSSARRAGYKGRILCGAGIVGRGDVQRALELGADGMLVASGIVKSDNWARKISEIASPLTSSPRKL